MGIQTCRYGAAWHDAEGQLQERRGCRLVKAWKGVGYVQPTSAAATLASVQATARGHCVAFASPNKCPDMREYLLAADATTTSSGLLSTGLFPSAPPWPWVVLKLTLKR